MRKLLLLGTGGTIACLPTDAGLAPNVPASELLSFLNMDISGVDCRDLFALDSSNIQPEEWHAMAAEIAAAQNTYCGVVIAHGTDTMAYTASMLSFMLQGIDIPVVLTGAQYPIVYPDSDGRINLKDALTAARSLPGGVYVCFGGAVMLGCRAVKVRTTSLNAFESINFPYIGAIFNGRFVQLHQPPARKDRFAFNDKIEPNVALIKLVPGTTPALFYALPACGYQGLVVEAFGLGGVHSIRRDHTEALVKLLHGGMPVVLSSQCLYEPSTISVYEVSRPLSEAGMLSAGDMTTEAAVTKLMWALGQSGSLDKVRRIMADNLCGELSPQPFAAKQEAGV